MNYTKSESFESIEQTMRSLKLGGLAKEWRNVEYREPEQYMRELLELEVREREANRMNRMIKQAGFRVIKTLDSFVWKPTIEVPATITREEIEAASFVSKKRKPCANGRVGNGQNPSCHRSCHETVRKGASCALFHSSRFGKYPCRKENSRHSDLFYDFASEARTACIGRDWFYHSPQGSKRTVISSRRRLLRAKEPDYYVQLGVFAVEHCVRQR